MLQLKRAFHEKTDFQISSTEVLSIHICNMVYYKFWKRLKMFFFKDYKQARKSSNKENSMYIWVCQIITTSYITLFSPSWTLQKN